MRKRKGYTDVVRGQIHWRMAVPENLNAPDLFCLHPAPFSGLAFTGIMPHLANGRRLIAPDYPGYGGSDKPGSEASIDVYADAMQAVITDQSGDDPIDLLGFHTGCFVVAQICLNRPDKVRRAVLIDVPAFGEEQRVKLLGGLGSFEVSDDISSLSPAWASGFVKRLESQPAERAFEMFVEQLRPGKDMNQAFKAAFSYPWEERLPLITTDTLILATQSGLLDATRVAATCLPAAKLVERLDIKRAVLDEEVAKTAEEVSIFLNEKFCTNKK